MQNVRIACDEESGDDYNGDAWDVEDENDEGNEKGSAAEDGK